MPVDESKSRLRSILESKTTQELEELLKLDFTNQDYSDSNAEYLLTIMEVIEEREQEARGGIQEDNEAAWNELKEYIALHDAESSDTGENEVSVNDHECKSSTEQVPCKHCPRLLRIGLIAAIIIILISAPAVAAKWNFIYAIAEWSKETFQFLIPNQDMPVKQEDPFESIRFAVTKYCNTNVIPKWSPAGSKPSGEMSVSEREDRTRITGTFKFDSLEFTIRVIIHSTPPAGLTMTYQTDPTYEGTLDLNGIEHRIYGNMDNMTAMWINGLAEVHIQGALSLEDMQTMIESIYWE